MLSATDKKEIQDIFAKEAGTIISQEIHALMPKILSQNGVMTPSRKNQRSRTQKSTADHPTPTDTPSRPPSVQTLPDGSTEAKLDFMYREMILRFEAVNQRFADLIHYSDKRFEDMNKRFEEMQKAIDKRFEEMQKAIDKRFEDMNKRFNSPQWMIGTGIALVAALMTIYRFVG